MLIAGSQSQAPKPAVVPKESPVSIAETISKVQPLVYVIGSEKKDYLAPKTIFEFSNILSKGPSFQLQNGLSSIKIRPFNQRYIYLNISEQ